MGNGRFYNEIDRPLSNERRVGRVGVIWRLCSSTFADYVYVNLDLVGQERSEKVVLIELRDVTPIEEGEE